MIFVGTLMEVEIILNKVTQAKRETYGYVTDRTLVSPVL